MMRMARAGSAARLIVSKVFRPTACMTRLRESAKGRGIKPFAPVSEILSVGPGPGEHSPSRIAGHRPQLLLDSDQLVVLGEAVRTGEAAGLDLPAIGGDGEVGDGGVLGLAGAVRHDRGVGGAVGGG